MEGDLVLHSPPGDYSKTERQRNLKERERTMSDFIAVASPKDVRDSVLESFEKFGGQFAEYNLEGFVVDEDFGDAEWTGNIKDKDGTVYSWNCPDSYIDMVTFF